MEFNAHKPIYLQICSQLYEQILRGELKADDRILSVRDYGIQLGVNPNTIMRSYETMTAAGIIYNKRGIGYFISAEAKDIVLKQMREEFGFKYVVSTLRESYSATFNGWKALIYDGKEFYQSKRYEINPIIDRVGGGDSFSGGLIHGLLTKPTQGEALEFAVAASALKHTINGDFNLVSVDEVESLAGGNANGRVQR